MYPTDIPNEQYQDRINSMFEQANNMPLWYRDVARDVRKEALSIRAKSIVEYDRACNIIYDVEDGK